MFGNLLCALFGCGEMNEKERKQRSFKFVYYFSCSVAFSVIILVHELIVGNWESIS